MAYVLLLSWGGQSQGARVRDKQRRKKSQYKNVLSRCPPRSLLNSVLRRVSPGEERGKNLSISFYLSLVKGLPKVTQLEWWVKDSNAGSLALEPLAIHQMFS